MSTTVQKIKERLGIVDVISSYITIEKSGANFKAKCPFHHEKTASFYISPDRQSYYCFGCAVKGDIFSFVQEFEGVDFLTSLKMLADKAGVVIESFSKKENGDNSTERTFEILEETTKFFQNNLKDNTEALTYLKKRNLNIETLRAWRLGFAKNDWRTLKTHLKDKGFSDKEMLDAGVIKENEKGETYDRFRDRIIFPIFDTAGRVVAFTGRIMHDKAEEPKYLNSPETELFDKSKILYGYNVAKKFIKQDQFVILVEGQMDLLMSHQSGLSNAVASSGTALTESHLEILKRLTDTMIIAYDADNAGKNATLRAWKLALKSGFETKAVFLPNGLDPADAIAKDPEVWKEAVKNAQNIIDYFIKNMEGEKDREDGDKVLKEKVLPLIKYVQSAIDRSRFLQKVSFISGITEQALTEELNKIKDEDSVEGDIKLPNKSANHNIPKVVGFYLNLLSKGDVYADEFKKLIEGIKSDFETLMPENDEVKNKLLFEIEIQYGELSGKELMVVGKELLKHFEEEILKDDFTKTMERLKKLESVHDMISVEKELKHCQEISLRLSKLNEKYKST